ncbi:hypothetical protein A1OE_654 [Candidatus Endolissoclinum faulkneri L2]|uniref:Uncharacterized protein n=1 Tax=Candidatus Endolissoclinum faulkneri L2 TaxID=1193729 RepID=K7YMV5_9PROT|nr:hypothetical protein A1OE_654 [Candidatus Endolissoclinum faulkneri L2]
MLFQYWNIYAIFVKIIYDLSIFTTIHCFLSFLILMLL